MVDIVYTIQYANNAVDVSTALIQGGTYWGTRWDFALSNLNIHHPYSRYRRRTGEINCLENILVITKAADEKLAAFYFYSLSLKQVIISQSEIIKISTYS
jgi:hypothetical protein